MVSGVGDIIPGADGTSAAVIGVALRVWEGPTPTLSATTGWGGGMGHRIRGQYGKAVSWHNLASAQLPLHL